MKQHLLATTAVISLAFAAAAFAQGTPSTAPAQKGAEQCKNLTGAALDSCMKAAPGRSGDSTARDSGRTPGASDSAASRSGATPGKDQGGTDAMGGTSGGGTSGKGSSKPY
jgi:hypothetical protein